MTANISLDSIYWNRAFSELFFTDQAFRTLEKLTTSVKRRRPDEVLFMIEDVCDELTWDVDDLNDFLHHEDLKKIAEIFRFELIEE